MSDHLGFNHQEVAVLATSFALVGFSAVAAILLMRTRLRATRNEEQLQSEIIADLQAQSDRLRALLFVEPQVLISWAAGDNRPQICGRRLAGDVPGGAAHRRNASSLSEPGCRPSRRCRWTTPSTRCARRAKAFLLNLSTSAGRAIEAMGRAIGGQAIVRIRELGGLRRELAESNLRYKTLQEETELLRDFAAAAPWPIWAKSLEGNLRYANAAYVHATEGKSVVGRAAAQSRTAGKRPARRD